MRIEEMGRDKLLGHGHGPKVGWLVPKGCRTSGLVREIKEKGRGQGGVGLHAGEEKKKEETESNEGKERRKVKLEFFQT
jgi:hypothetical protein